MFLLFVLKQRLLLVETSDLNVIHSLESTDNFIKLFDLIDSNILVLCL